MSNGLCARCGSSGYGCYECIPKTYTHDQMEAAIKRALEGAANMIRDGMDDSEWYNPVRAIRSLDPAQFIEEKKG